MCRQGSCSNHQGKINGDLYSLSASTNKVAFSANKESTDIWHTRLGHPFARVLQQLHPHISLHHHLPPSTFHLAVTSPRRPFPKTLHPLLRESSSTFPSSSTIHISPFSPIPSWASDHPHSPPGPDVLPPITLTAPSSYPSSPQTLPSVSSPSSSSPLPPPPYSFAISQPTPRSIPYTPPSSTPLPSFKTHPMITRSDDGTWKPKVPLSTRHPLASCLLASFTSFHENHRWPAAMHEEFNALPSLKIKLGLYFLVLLP